MHILHTIFHKFLKVLLRRIWPIIKSFFRLWSFPLFLWLNCLTLGDTVGRTVFIKILSYFILLLVYNKWVAQKVLSGVMYLLMYVKWHPFQWLRILSWLTYRNLASSSHGWKRSKINSYASGCKFSTKVILSCACSYV